MSCENCSKGDCSGCAGCGACGELLTLTKEQAAVLHCFSVPFLPVAKDTNGLPVYYEDGRRIAADALLALAHKELIQIDYMIPLQGCDYADYDAYPVKGSMALTMSGQDVLEQLDIQEIE